MGQSSPDGFPTFRAARSSSGWASQTSTVPSRPFRTSRTTALRASRYSTRASTLGASGLPDAPCPEVTVTGSEASARGHAGQPVRIRSRRRHLDQRLSRRCHPSLYRTDIVTAMLDLAILGLLEEQELHGYEIRRQLREGLGLLANVSYGSLYPALARLEAGGAVEAVEPDGAPGAATAVPPTGSLSGEWAVLRARRRAGSRGRRSRKVYRITDRGRVLFAELLAEGGAPDDARSFGLRLAFARHLAPPSRMALLERRRAQLVQRL